MLNYSQQAFHRLIKNEIGSIVKIDGSFTIEKIRRYEV